MNITELIGKTLSFVQDAKHGDDQIVFNCTDGTAYRMCHYQVCCESVSVEDVDGDIKDLIGSPILEAEERTNSKDPRPDEDTDFFTWTFYTIRTIKASVTIRWLGVSNGYYSEEVDFEQID